MTSPRTIINEVAAHHRLSIRSFMEKARFKHLVDARWEAMYRLSTETRLSARQIGTLFGRDHTTIVHGARKYADRIGRPNPWPHGQPARRRAFVEALPR